MPSVEEAIPETEPVAATIDDHTFAPSEADSTICAVCGRPDVEHVVFPLTPVPDEEPPASGS